MNYQSRCLYQSCQHFDKYALKDFSNCTGCQYFVQYKVSRPSVFKYIPFAIAGIIILFIAVFLIKGSNSSSPELTVSSTNTLADTTDIKDTKTSTSSPETTNENAIDSGTTTQIDNMLEKVSPKSFTDWQDTTLKDKFNNLLANSLGRFKTYITFNKNLAVPNDESLVNIDKLATLLTQDKYKDNQFVILGYLDNSGGSSNQKLSQDRADFVMNELLKRSSSLKGRLITSGMGQELPLIPSSTEEGMKINRRVEIWMVKN